MAKKPKKPSLSPLYRSLGAQLIVLAATRPDKPEKYESLAALCSEAAVALEEHAAALRERQSAG
jgi:hypothetical protein